METTNVSLPQELMALNKGSQMTTKAAEHLSAFAGLLENVRSSDKLMEEINFEEPTREDEIKASEIRKAIKKHRVEAEKTKDARKKDLLEESNLIQAAYNLVKSESETREQRLQQVEDYRRILEEKRIAQLTANRMQALAPYGFVTDPKLVGQMNDDTFSSFLAGAKKTYEDKIQAEKDAEEAMMKAAKVRQLNDVRARIIRPMWALMTDEEADVVLGELSQDEFNSLVKLLMYREQAANEARQKELAEQEAERARLQAEAEKACKEAKDAAAKTRAIEEEKAKLEKEKRDKEAADLKAKQEEEARKAAEEKAQKAADRKAARAPDKTKLHAFLSQISEVELPLLKTEDGQEAYALISQKFEDFKQQVAKVVDQL